MTTHMLKTNQTYWESVRNGDKTFEVRANDRGFQKGDLIVLLPQDYCLCGLSTCSKNSDKPTPMTRTITYVYAGDPYLRDGGGIVPGYVVLGFLDESQARQRPIRDGEPTLPVATATPAPPDESEHW